MTYRYLPLVTALAVALRFDAALADVFSVDEPEVEKGAQEVEVNAAVQNGFPVNADPVRYSMELEYTYGVTKWLSLSPLVDFDKPDGDDLHATIAAVESVWFPVEVGKTLTLAWFTEVEGAVHHDETNTVVFGPIIQVGDEKGSLTLNPYFEKTFGRNREEGVEFTYGWQLKTSLNEPFAVGLEGFGVIPDIAHAPGIEFQEHRLGPILYYERELAGAQEGETVAIELGVLFGLREATPDVSGKVNASLAF